MGALWFWAALIAAILWGFSYALSEKVLNEKLTPAFLLLFAEVISLPVWFVICYYKGSLKTGIDAVMESPRTLMEVVAIATAWIVGNYLIFYAVTEKNATMTTLIEITYPLFTIFFVWLFMHKVDLSPATAIGALLIFAGVGLIALKA